MVSFLMHSRIGLYSFVVAVIASTSLLTSAPVKAQGAALEEVIVTAQRREQSLQEVPISIEVHSGAEIQMQGYRNLEDLAKFSPSVNIQDRSNRVNTTVRGFGTSGSSQTLVSAAPFFVDGLHYAATEMGKNAFLDVERIEVLKGPQPLHFGMNATAGAFNITSKRPTPEWEGDLSAEFGNDGHHELEAAAGGPLTDTLGIRVATKLQRDNGPLKNAVDGRKYPKFDNLAGRVMLEWTPNADLTVLAKYEQSRIRSGSTIDVGCLTEGPLTGFPSDSPIDGDVVDGADAGNSRSVWASPPKGLSNSGDLPLVYYPERGEGQNCFDDDYGFSREGPYLAPPANIVEESSDSIFDGHMDVRNIINLYASQEGPGGAGDFGADTGGLQGSDDVDTYNALLAIDYRLPNGMTLKSETGHIGFVKQSSSENCQCPFSENYNGRQTDINTWSQQFRLESPTEGYELGNGISMDFMVGAFYQEMERDVFNSSLRANVRRAQRFNKAWEEARWAAGFGSLAFNFLDRQVTLEGGVRYTDIHKDVFIRGRGSQWVFEGIPCDSDGTDADPTTCAADPDFKRVYTDLAGFTSFDGRDARQTTNVAGDVLAEVRSDNPQLFVDDVNSEDLWVVAGWRETTAVPLNYRSPVGSGPVGLSAPVFNRIRNGPMGPCATCVEDVNQDADNVDFQVVGRFTPNALGGRHTFYAKYAEAFKGPVTDTGQSTIPDTLETLTFAPEYSSNYELGAKGTLMDNRVRYDITLFRNVFKDLQTSAAAPQFNPLEEQSVSLNAGKQVVQGVEFSVQAAVTERLTLSVGGALMDGEMKQLDGGGCSEDELIAAAINVDANPGDFSADAVDFARNDILAAMGPTRQALLPSASELPPEFFINGGCRMADTPAFAAEESSVGGRETINRSGFPAAFTPDWKFVATVDYFQPVMDNYEVFFNAKGFIADEMLISPEIFDNSIKWNSGHGDLNLTAGFGTADGTWRVAGYVQNLFEDKPSFNPAYELEKEGIVTAGQESEVRGLGDSAFMNYGIRLQYRFQ